MAPLTDSQYFAIILGTPAYYKILYAYAQKSLVTESLDFLTAVAAYRKHPNKKKAIEIIDRYVSSTGADPINIDSGVNSALMDDRKKYVADRQKAKSMGFFKRHWSSGQRKAAEGLFDDAVDHITSMFLGDVFRRFKMSSEGKALLAFIDKQQAKSEHVRGVLLDAGF